MSDQCQLCHKEAFKYTCPKCNICYCSLACYKSPEHLKCTEEFYKSCVQEELSSAGPNSQEDVKKMYEILRRMREADAGLNSEGIPNGFDDALDSDDDQPAGEEGNGGENKEEEEDDEDDIAARMKGVDINDSNELWDLLTETEREEFHRLLESGEIMELLPAYKPWWSVKPKNSKIVVLSDPNGDADSEAAIPEIAQNIPKFQDICKKEPSPCLHYNLWNLVAAYACTARFFSGEHLTNPGEAAAHLVNLSATLKYGTNFEDAEDAIISVEMEALTTGNGAAGPQGVAAGADTKREGAVLLVESREQLQNDARQLMASRHFKLAALSDVRQLLHLARVEAKAAKAEQSEFQKLYAMRNGSVVLDRQKLMQLGKKVEFFIAYVRRDDECDVK